MSSLEFQINLSGNFATSLGSANKELEHTEKGAHAAAHEVEGFESEIGKLTGSVGGLGFNLEALAKGGSLFTFDLAEGLEGVLEVAHKLVEEFVDLGKEIVETAGKTQDINLAVKLNVGEEGVEKVNHLAETFQEKTRFSASQIKQALLPLLQQGLGSNIEQLGDLTAAATDYAARTNTGISGVETALESFGNIALKGQVNFRILKQLKISENQFNTELASLLHTNAAGAEKLMKANKVGKEDLLTTALNLLAKQQGGVIGAPAESSARTLGGTLDRLSTLKERLFEGIADSPGIRAIQDALDRFIATMSGPAGQQLMGSIDHLLVSLSKYITPEYVEGFISSLVNGFKSVTDGVSMMLDLLIKAKSVAEATVGPLIAAAHFGNKLLGNVEEPGNAGGGDWKDELYRRFQAKEIGAADVERLVAEHLHGGPITAANENAGAHADIAMGIPGMATGGVVDRPTLRWVGEAGPEAVMPLDSLAARRALNDTAFGSAEPAARGGASIVIGDIIFQLSAGTPMDQAREAAQLFRSELKSFLDEVAA